MTGSRLDLRLSSRSLNGNEIDMSIFRNPGLVFFSFFFGVALSAVGQGWSSPVGGTGFHRALPEAPGVQSNGLQDGPSQSGDQFAGAISGTVVDASGGEIAGARVTLENTSTKLQRNMTTNGSGFFSFDAAGAGVFKITISSPGFANWVSEGIVVHPGQSYDVPQIVLQIALAATDVDVFFSQHDIAEEQMKLEEKQRVLGIIPNFYVTYNWHAAPLSSGQKFRLAVRTSIDPVTFAGAAFAAGVEQSQNGYGGYGEGAKGYFARFGASYGDGFTGAFLGGAILPSILHQDPRYFYKGRGSIRSRALYAIATAVICKGDNGRWQPNYSNVLGNLISAGISNSYYPPANRGAQLTIDNTLIGTGLDAVGSLFQEFLIKKISRGVQP